MLGWEWMDPPDWMKEDAAAISRDAPLGTIRINAHDADQHIDLASDKLRNTIGACDRDIRSFDAQFLGHQLAQVDVVAFVFTFSIDEAHSLQFDNPGGSLGSPGTPRAVE